MQIVCHSKERFVLLMGSEGVGFAVNKMEDGQKNEASPETVEVVWFVVVVAVGRIQGGGAKVLGGVRM